MTPIKLYTEDDEDGIEMTLEDFVTANELDEAAAAAIRLEVVLQRGVYIGGGGAAPAFAIHLNRATA